MTENELRKLIDSAVKQAVESQIETIAQRVEQRFYARVGQQAVVKLLQLIGFVAVAAALYFAGKGAIQ